MDRGTDGEISRRFLGVSDLATVRFSLPAQLLEPTPNLGLFGIASGWMNNG